MYLILADSMWTTVGATLLQGLMPVLATIVTVAITALLKKGIDRLGVTRSQDVDFMIDKYVGIGIGYAEKFALNRLGGDGKSLVKSGDKMSLAVKAVMNELDQSGITGVTEALIVARIESALGVESKKEVTS